MTCINCGTAMQSFFTKKTFHIVRCQNCQLMAVENVPEDLSPFYSEGYFTGDVTLDGYMNYDLDKEVTKKTYVDYLKVIEKQLQQKTGITMFEVGCATGFFMELAEKRGWKTEGIDISEYAVQKAKEKGLKAVVGTLDSYLPSDTFDTVVMHDVIEHVKEPIKTIKQAGQVLRTGGLLVFTTPDAGSIWARVMGRRWHAFVPPQHLFYFSAKNLGNLLEKNGFKVVYTAHHGKWFTIPYIIRLLYSWTGLSIFSKLAGWTSHTFLKKVSLPINVGDTLLIMAEKKSGV